MAECSCSKVKADNFAHWISRNIALSARPDGKFIRTQEKRLKKKVLGYFKKQQDWILKEIESLSLFNEDGFLLSRNGIRDEINNIMENFPFKVAMAETIIASMRTSLLKGGKNSVKKLKLGDFGISFDLKNREALKFLGGKLSHELSNYRGTIHQTTVDRISKILYDAADRGLSYQKTAELIIDQGEEGVFSQARGELIATREIGIAYEKGNNIPVKEFRLKNPDRVVEKAWQTVGDDRVTPKHRENQSDGWIIFEGRFTGTGDEHAPGSDNPRCRCATKYQILPPSK